MTHASSLLYRATAGALLLIIPVATQLVLWPDLADMPWGHELFAVSQLLSWALLSSVCLGIASVHPGAVRNRAGRTGRRAVLAGCGLQMLFALAYGVSTVVRGEPLEASFVLFLLGFLALLVGGVVWGLVLRREPHLRLAGNGFLAMAVLGLLAIAVGDNFIHDIALLSSYAAWIVIGLGAVGSATPDTRDGIRSGSYDDQNV